jgi:hypothetical protein
MKSLIAALMMFPLAAFSQSYQLPIECGNENEMREMLKEFKEVPAFQMTTLRENVNTSNPMKIHTTLYVNFQTKTWTLVEYFPGDKTHCIISSGEDIRPANNGKPA